jgi:hypothetical protein
MAMTITSIVTGYFDTHRASHVSPTTPEGEVEMAISAADAERILRRAARETLVEAGMITEVAPNPSRSVPQGPSPTTRPTVR